MLDTLDRKFIFGGSHLFFGDTIMTANDTNTRILRNSITEGKTKICMATVKSGTKFLDVDLDWTNKSNKLSIKSYSPSGGILGTKYDKSDGSVDSEITYRINAEDGGYLETGSWRFKVHGDTVKGTENFTFKCSAK